MGSNYTQQHGNNQYKQTLTQTITSYMTTHSKHINETHNNTYNWKQPINPDIHANNNNTYGNKQ